MSTNDTIIGVIDKGSFRFPVEFDLFGIHQYIDNVTFDTGCSHSLISVKSLNIGDKSIEELKKAAHKSELEVETILRNYMSEESMQRVLKSPLIRYDYMASNYTIDGVVIGNFKVRVSFDLGKANLIGMHIIKELYTKIFSEKGKVCLFATKNPELADKELDAFRQQLELIDK